MSTDVSAPLPMLYRVMTFEQFVDAVAGKRLYLTQLLRWEDPYEAQTLRQMTKDYFEKAPEMAGLPERVRDAMLSFNLKAMYGQSWTTLSESDALWRIYSQDKMGVRITVRQTDIAKCLESAEFAGQVDIEWAMGNVLYCTPEMALDQAQKYVGSDKTLPELCLFKREQFSHEQEYRFCAHVFPQHIADAINSGIDFTQAGKEEQIVSEIEALSLSFPPVYYYRIDPALILDVTLDPRAPDWFLGTVTTFFSQYNKETPVRKSTLYERPAV